MTAQIVNFGRNVAFSPARHVVPRTEEDLLAALNDPHAGPVRVVASRHAWNPGIATPGTSIDMRNFDSVRVFEKDDRQWVTVGGGCRIKHLLRALNKQGLTIPSVGLIAEQTVAGAISTGTHGSGKHSLSHYAATLRIACFNPDSGKAEIRTVDSGDELRAARCAVGCLGVIVDVTFPCVEQYFVTEQTVACESLDDVLAAEDEMPLQQFFLIPHSWVFYAQRRRPAEPGRRGFMAWLYAVYWFVFIDIALHLNIKLCASVLRSRRLIRTFFRRILPASILPKWVVNDRSDKLLIMKHELFRHLELELFVKASRLAEATEYLTRVLKHADGSADALPESVLESLQRIGLTDYFNELHGHFTHHYPICFRRVLPDDTLISMSAGNDECWYAISLITYVRPREPFWKVAAFLAGSMQSMFEARIHWGKWFPLDGDAVERMYPRMDEFRDICARFDPRGVFCNEFIREKIRPAVVPGNPTLAE